MATCRDIIADAYRVAGVVGLEDEPTAAEAAFALSGLQSMFHAWITGGMFGTLTDVFATDDYTAKENERVTVDSATVTIPVTFEAEASEARAPLQLSAIVVVTDTATTSYIYDRREWRAVEALTLDDVCPLSDFGARGLACCLALEVAALPAFGAPITPSVVQAATAFRAAVMRARHSARTTREIEYF